MGLLKSEVSRESILECAVKLRECSKTLFENEIGEMIRRRFSSEQNRQVLKFLEGTRGTSFGQCNPSINTRSSDGYWMRFSSGYVEPKKVGYEYAVTFKEYFTIGGLSFSRPESFPTVANRLTQSAHLIAEDLYSHITEPFYLKTPLWPGQMLAHVDTLVVHYSDPELGSTIRSIVSNTCRKSGLVLDKRSIRSDTGFDAYTSSNDTIGTHSQLISRIIATRLQPDGVKKVTDENLAEFLKEEVRSVARWSHGKVMNELGSNR